MKKIAIITIYGNTNFGNKLQNYAVQRYFEQMGFEVVTLPCSEQLCPSHSIKMFVRRVAHRCLQSLGFEKDRIKRQLRLKKRQEYIKGFSDWYIKLGPDIGYSRINGKLDMDYFVTGSDQVWHYAKRDKKALEYFFLPFATPAQRLTIAPSFAFDKVPKKYYRIYKKGLDGFQFLSVREEQGTEIIKKLTGKDATVLLDPTMLIDTSEWLKILKKLSQYVDDKYIFVYALGGFNEEVKAKTCKLADNLGLKAIDIMDIDSDYYIHTRPNEFLYWIHNARLVVTDSFHASVFSILFERPFVVTERSDLKGMGSRLDTLFNKFGIAGRYFDELKEGFDNAGEIRERLFAVDYSNVPEVLESERKKAEEFYKKCFYEES